MSQENVEIVRRIYAAWERGDFTSADWAHPDVEFLAPDMAALWHKWLEVWESYRVEVDEYRTLDDERILVLMRHCGRGKTSGLDVGQTGANKAGANLLHVRDAKVTRIVLYWDRERALEDLGISE